MLKTENRSKIAQEPLPGTNPCLDKGSGVKTPYKRFWAASRAFGFVLKPAKTKNNEKRGVKCP